jgi:DNA polymerase-4/protein ImuB
MSIRDAFALAPSVVIVETNPVREAVESRKIQTALEAISPLVEADPHELGCWYLDLTGLERHFDSHEAIARRLLRSMPPLLRPRIGIASGKFPARVVAGRAEPGSFRIVPPDETVSFLETEPVTSLPASPETLHLLNQLGLERLGLFAALPSSAIVSRLGMDGLRLWELARGRDSDPVTPSPYRELIRERIELPQATGSREGFLFALHLLVQRASRRPRMDGRGARRVLLRVLFENGGSWEKRFALRDPIRGRRLSQLLRHRLAAVEFPQPVTELELEISELDAEAVYQENLPGWRPSRPKPLIEAARQLKSRYGDSPLFHIVEVEPWSRIPERRHALMPFDP